MKQVIFFLFCVLTVHCQEDEEFEDYRLSFRAVATTTPRPSKDCDQPGIMCTNCTNSVYCVDVGGKFQSIPIETCLAGSSCSQGFCTNETNPLCVGGSRVSFTCNDIGMFPDPFDCKVYHVCSEIGTDLKEFSCSAKYAYDPISTYCKIQIPNGCPAIPPVPYCLKIGQTGPLLTVHCQEVEEFEDYRLSFRAVATTTPRPPKECDQSGIMCTNCTHSVYCVDVGGKFQSIPMEACPVGSSCSQGFCMFPDPFDCKVYHVCSETGTDLKTFSCSAKYAYDPISTYCKMQIPNGCPAIPPVPYCLQIGQTDPLFIVPVSEDLITYGREVSSNKRCR
ncbi:uncharacterized protein CBL_13715 [Carabus blaptoides fortunei]